MAKDAPLYILKFSPLLCNGDLEKGKGELRRVIGGEGPLAGEERPMKKWYDEEYRFEIQVVGYLRGEKPQGYCRNGEEIGDIYTLRLSRQSGGAGDLLQSHAAAVFPDGGGAQRR